jgi:hypothetical protein
MLGSISLRYYYISEPEVSLLCLASVRQFPGSSYKNAFILNQRRRGSYGNNFPILQYCVHLDKRVPLPVALLSHKRRTKSQYWRLYLGEDPKPAKRLCLHYTLAQLMRIRTRMAKATLDD